MKKILETTLCLVEEFFMLLPTVHSYNSTVVSTWIRPVEISFPVLSQSYFHLFQDHLLLECTCWRLHQLGNQQDLHQVWWFKQVENLPTYLVWHPWLGHVVGIDPDQSPG